MIEWNEQKIKQWVESLDIPNTKRDWLKQVTFFAMETGGDCEVDYAVSCFEQGMDIAMVLAEINSDVETIAAGIIFPLINHSDLSIDDVTENVGQSVSKLFQGLMRIQEVPFGKLHESFQKKNNVDNVRKMLLAMVQDVRAVIVKLAERLVVLQNIKHKDTPKREELALETQMIYAPLANRLGLHHIKWQLEDLSFFELDPDGYKEIANSLMERRSDRDRRVEKIVGAIKNMLVKAGIRAEVYGRAKHIYSIKRKMEQKKLNFSELYDAIAVRILINGDEIEQCYKALSLVHEMWKPIPEEFDDYISRPKKNGYQSVHTAVVDDDGKNFEVQIRTESMHKSAELGLAAHWMYKEGKSKQSSFEEKISWLRQLLEWQKELSDDAEIPEELEKNIFEDRVYVFTPDGDIIDLMFGATPLDFAYTVHTQVGHHCVGAKANGKMVQLTYALKTGDVVEIVTNKSAHPSRDWLAARSGYLKTSSAKAKVLQWFKKQEFQYPLARGKEILEKTFKKMAFKKTEIESISISKIASELNFHSADGMFIALGNGSIKIGQITHIIQNQLTHLEHLEEHKAFDAEQIVKHFEKDDSKRRKDVLIVGLDDLLAKIAKCCKPIPGDRIVGYITQGRGVTIHRHDCDNLMSFVKDENSRIIPVEWAKEIKQQYAADIFVIADDRDHLIRDITNVLANEKIALLHISTNVNRKNRIASITLTVEVGYTSMVDLLISRIQQLPGIIRAVRN